MQRYRLPTEAEWEFAARGKNQSEFPWDNADVKNGDGCFYANFKPDRGNYTKDGNLITSKVGIYSPNSNGLYDMAGNVAEWTSTVYTEAGVDAMNDLNPDLKYNAAKEDPYRLKKKSVRGVMERPGIFYPLGMALLGIPEPATLIYRIPLRKKSGYHIECQAETIKK